jgi:hypothetical protein
MSQYSVLSKIQLFFLNKGLSVCYQLLVNLQSSEKVDFDNFFLAVLGFELRALHFQGRCSTA